MPRPNVVVGLTLLLLSACNFRDDKVQESEAPPPEAASLNYAEVNSQVFSPYCLGCHSASGGNLGGLNLESYTNVLEHAEGIRLTAIVHRSMPPTGSLSAEAYALLKAWLAAGAPETAE